MKVEEFNSNPAVVSQLAVVRNDKPEAGEAHGETAKQQAAADKVELSGYMPVVPASKQRREDIRVDRVEELRAQISSGSYQVSGKDLAEKMFSKIVMK